MKRLVLFSGGMDSTVVLAYVLSISKAEDEVRALSFNYGSKHNEREWESAKAVAQFYDVPLERIHLDFVPQLFKSDLLSTGGDVPDGHYADESMKKTVVPFRNGIMLSIAAGYAESNDIDEVYLANHAGDHTIYPDCRVEFVGPMMEAIKQGTYKRVRFVAPFAHIDKSNLAALGACLDVPFHLTWSCYKGGEAHCGTCGTCVERMEAFQESNLVDPTVYRPQLKDLVMMPPQRFEAASV